MAEATKKEICLKLLDVMKNCSHIDNQQIDKMKESIKKNKSYIINESFEEDSDEKYKKIENAENIIKDEKKLENLKNLDFDFELWKSQKTCGGLVPRWGTVKNSRFITSKIKPVCSNQYKDKTSFLKKCKVSKDSNNRVIPNVPWDNPKMLYRLIINYNGGTFHCYFDDKKKRDDVEIALFSNGEEMKNEKMHIKRLFEIVNKNITSNYKNYGIKKMIDVKNKVKKRKILLSQIKTLSEENHDSIIKFAKDNLNKENIEKYEKDKKPENNKVILRGKKKEKSDLESMSTTLPLISAITPFESSKQSENMELSEMMRKLEKFENIKNKNEIDLNKLRNNEKKICSFKNISVNEVIDQIPDKDADLYKNQNSDFGFPDPDSIKQAKEIIADKGFVNLIFVQDSKNNEPKENSQLNNNNIYDISNVFLNTDIQTNKIVENNLVIYGPKLDLTKSYYYKNKDVEDEYLEPEIVHEKFMNGFSCKQDNKYIRLQIFHLLYYISKSSLNNVIEKIDPLPHQNKNPEDIFIFMISVTIQKNKKKKLRPVKAKKYENDYFVVEFNNEIIIDKNDILEDGIKLEVEMIPIPTLQQIGKNNNQYIIDLLAMNQYIDYFYIGNLIFKKDASPQNYIQYEFQLSKNGRNVNHTTLVAKFTESEGEFYRFNGFYGKDYSLGDYTYVVEEVNHQFFDEIKKSKCISEDKKQNLFDVQFNENKQILFRIPEDPKLALQFEQDMQKEISKDDLEKIKFNSMFKYLPECTKFVNKESFKKSKVYESLSEEDKRKVDLYSSSWFYKTSALKLKKLTRNVGINKHHVISQKNILDGTIKNYDLNDDNNLIRISDNTFNLLDMKEIEPESCSNFNNFQWAFSIKFNDQTQMVTFVKLLKYLRQKSNYDMLIKQIQEENPISGISVILRENQKTKIENDEDKNKFGNDWIAQIESLNVRNDYKLMADSNLYFQLKRKTPLNKKKNTKCLLTTLNNEECKYKNSLLNNQSKLKDEYERIINSSLESNNKNEFDFCMVNKNENDFQNDKKCMEIKAERFNKGKKNLNFKKSREKFEVKMDLNLMEHNMDCLMWLENKNTKERQYFTTKTMDLINITSYKQADFFILPLYKVEDNEKDTIDCRSIEKTDRKIYGKLRINFYKDLNNEDINNKQFEELYYDDNKQKYIESLDSDSLSTSIDSIISYKYQPNLLRRITINDLCKKTNKLMNKIVSDAPINNIIYNQVHEYYDKKNINHKCQNQIDEYYLTNPKKKVSNNLDETGNKITKRMFKYIFEEEKNKEFDLIFAESEWRRFFKDKFQVDIDSNFEKYFNSKHIPDDRDIFLVQYKDNLDNLINYGLPSKKFREKVWNYFLNKKELVILTLKKINGIEDNSNPITLNEEEVENKGIELYEQLVSNVENKKNNSNIIFSLIDNDLNYLKVNDEYDIDVVREIVRAYFEWTQMNITIDIRNDDNLKYTYFDGILNIALRIYSHFKNIDNNQNESERNNHRKGEETVQNKEKARAFWMLVGMAQTIELFRQPDAIRNDKMNFINEYALVTKLITECHFPKIYNKFLSLNIPIEKFVYSHLDSLYCDYFQDDILFNLLDILIYQSIIKSNLEVYQYLRILCAIPVTLFQSREKKILQCQTVCELESVIGEKVFKATTKNKFISKLLSNVNKFYYYEGFIKQLMKFSFINEETKWDTKRDNLINMIYNHFYQVREDNKNNLSYILNQSETPQEDKSKSKKNNENQSETPQANQFESQNNQKPIFKDFEKFSENYFNGVNNELANFSYSQSENTPTDEVYSIISVYLHKLNIINQKDAFDSYNNLSIGIKFVGSNEYSSYVSEKQINFDKNTGIISDDIKNGVFYKGRLNDIQTKNLKYMCIDLMESEKLICSFKINLHELELMNITKLIVESEKSENKNNPSVMLELSIMKFFGITTITSDKYCLYQSLFGEPIMQNNAAIEDQFNHTSSNSNSAFASAYKNLWSQSNKIEQANFNFEVQSNEIEGKAMNSFLLKNSCFENADKNVSTENIFVNKKNDKFSEKIMNTIKESILKKLLSDETDEEYIKRIEEWLKSGNVSFEEVLYGLILVDPNISSITERLEFLYSVAQMENKLVLNSDDCSIKKVKELFYALYKRFMIYFSKSDIDRMVDYELKKEKLLNVKYVLIYNERDENLINDYIYDKERFSQDDLQTNCKDKYISEAVFYEDLTSQFNSYANTLVNHYNCKSVSNEIVSLILKNIIESHSNLKTIKINGCNKIKIFMDYDNIQTIYNFNYNLKNGSIYLNKDSSNNDDDLEKVFNKNSESIYLTNTYNNSSSISFNRFRHLFYKMPFLLDCIRPMFSFTSASKESTLIYDKIIVKIEFNGYNYKFILSKNKNEYNDQDSEQNDTQYFKYLFGKKVYESFCLKDVIDIIIKDDSISNEFSELSKKLHLRDYFKSYIELPQSQLREIQLFDCLGSCHYFIQDKSNITIQLKENNNYQNNNRLNKINRNDGYTKFILDNFNNFEWRKCKINQNENEVNLLCLKNDNPVSPLDEPIQQQRSKEDIKNNS